MRDSRRRGVFLLLSGIAAALLLAGAVLLLRFSARYTLIGGRAYERSSSSLDLRGENIPTLAGLRRLYEPQELDLRSTGLTPEQAAALQSRFPRCILHYDIPLRDRVFDNDAESLTIPDFTADDVPALRRFPSLRVLDCRGCTDYEALAALETAMPKLRVLYDISLGGRCYSHTSRVLYLPAGTDLAELRDRLPYFTALRTASIDGSYPQDEQLALQQAFPDIFFRWSVETVCALRFSSAVTELNLAGYGGFTLAELKDTLPLFPRLKLIDLTGCGFPAEELFSFREELGGVELRFLFELFGTELCSTDRIPDLTFGTIGSFEDIDTALSYFPKAEGIVIGRRPMSDEEMLAYARSRTDVKIYWNVYFGDFFLRTDAESFIATIFPYGYSFLENEELEPLRYCTQLIALDIGHMDYSDITPLGALTKLRWLILADTQVSDISVLENMPELYYLELFQSQVRDLSPLLELKNLRHLNLAYCPVSSIETLKQMTWLERLWIPGTYLSWAQTEELRAALPDTKIVLYADGATAAGWREDPAYFEMRDVFGAYYMPG